MIAYRRHCYEMKSSDARKQWEAAGSSRKRTYSSVAQAARRTQVSESAWRSWIASRRVTVVRFGRAVRIPDDEIDRMAEESAIPGIPDRE
jgi:excisionase family DNA binding protein